MGLALVIIGIIFIVLYNKQNKANKRQTARVQGTCIDIQDKGNDNGDFDSTIRHWRFKYMVDGKEYTTKYLLGIPGDPQIGDQVTLRYNPKKPEDSGYDYQSDDKTHYIRTIGIVLLVIGIILAII
ncbi:MAG: DUF3592 domain-containing protein [Lachnospiraceae bacterium]|nr:DUF3592 domain-containing protein [Lachnospiraceae bacterium]